MKLKVFDSSKKELEYLDVSDKMFDEKFNSYLIYDAFKNELNNKRQGNSSTKTRSMVSGTTKKPWRQKGTGNARAGTNKSPLWVGGGIIFGPHKRNYRYDLNKKTKQKAFNSLISYLLRNNKLVVIDKLEIDGFKTSVIFKVFSGISSKNKVLLVISSKDKASRYIKKSSENIPWLKVFNIESLELNTLYRSNEIFFTKEAILSLNSRYDEANVVKKKIENKELVK